ncbi:MAG TPA: YggT family protein [Gemmatimonadales bacterium]
MGGIALTIDLILRGIVIAAFTATGLVALTHWMVQEQRIAPFGPWVNGVRRASDPVLRPLERMLVRQGRNPQEGSFWLLAIVVVGGIVLITVGRWLTRTLLTMTALTQAGPFGWLRFIVELAFNLLLLAIVVRVIGSWLSIGRYRRWMRPFFYATDWLVEPIRRRLPPLGMIDLSPLLAYVVILFARAIVLALL